MEEENGTWKMLGLVGVFVVQIESTGYRSVFTLWRIYGYGCEVTCTSRKGMEWKVRFCEVDWYLKVGTDIYLCARCEMWWCIISCHFHPLEYFSLFVHCPAVENS